MQIISYLKNKYGSPYGMLQTDSTGKIYATTMSGRIVGWYDPQRDVTCTPTGSIVGYGNIVATLLTPQ